MVEPVTTFQLAKLALSIADKALKIRQGSDQARLAVGLDEANKKLDALVSAPLREAIFYFNTEDYDNSRSRAITAINVDEMSAVGHLILALSDLAKETNREEGLAHLVKAMRLNPFLLPDGVWAMGATRTLASLGSPQPERPGTTVPLEAYDARLLALVNGPVPPRWLLSIGHGGFVNKGLSYGTAISPRPSALSHERISRASLAVDPINPDLQFLAIEVGGSHVGLLNAKSGEHLPASTVKSISRPVALLMATPSAVVTVADVRGAGQRVQLRDPQNGRILRSYAPTVFEDIFFPRLFEYLKKGVRWHIPEYCAASYARSNFSWSPFTDEEMRDQIRSGAPRYPGARPGDRKYHLYHLSRPWQLMDPYGRGLANIVMSNEFYVGERRTNRLAVEGIWATVRSL